jgi:hypothetical protein
MSSMPTCILQALVVNFLYLFGVFTSVDDFERHLWTFSTSNITIEQFLHHFLFVLLIFSSCTHPRRYLNTSSSLLEKMRHEPATRYGHASFPFASFRRCISRPSPRSHPWSDFSFPWNTLVIAGPNSG